MGADLQTLRTRVAEATEPSRELDAEIYAAIFKETPVIMDTFGAEPMVRYGDSIMWVEVPRYTLSIDACVALVERLGWRVWILDCSIGNSPGVMLKGPVIEHFPEDDVGPFFSGPAWASGRAKTPPLAICCALLAALAERGEA